MSKEMNFFNRLNRLLSIVPFRMLLTIGLAFCLIFGFGGSIMIIVLHFNPILWITVIGFELIMLGLFFPLVIMIYRPYLIDIDRMEAGEAWTHWRYNQVEWQTFKHLEARFNRRNFLGIAVATVIIGIIAVIIGLLQPADSDGRSEWLPGGLITIGCGILVSLIWYALSNSTLAHKSVQGEVYISPIGIYQVPGGYQPLFGLGQALSQIELMPGEPAYLRFDCLVTSRASASNRVVAEIAIPADSEEEANRLLERFDREILHRISSKN